MAEKKKPAKVDAKKPLASVKPAPAEEKKGAAKQTTKPGKPKSGIKCCSGVPLLIGIAIIIVIAVIAAVILFMPGTTGAVVKSGDTVSILYLVNSTDDSFSQSGNYTFVSGAGQTIDGVEEAIIGMAAGQEKTFTVTPEKGYGEYDPAQIAVWPLSEDINRVVNLTTEIFNMSFNEMPVVGVEYDTVVYPWKAKVTKIENGQVFMEQEPEDGQAIELPYGNTTITVVGDKIRLTLKPIVGERFTAVYGPYGFPVIKDANVTHMMLDLNHQLAGKTLRFTIKVTDIKAGVPGAQAAGQPAA
jgi:FKBP-type peptidyl-prolyl cis-trans isomerase 2